MGGGADRGYRSNNVLYGRRTRSTKCSPVVGIALAHQADRNTVDHYVGHTFTIGTPDAEGPGYPARPLLCYVKPDLNRQLHRFKRCALPLSYSLVLGRISYAPRSDSLRS